MQVDVGKGTTVTADTVERVMGDVGMAPLPKSFRFGRFSLDVENGL